MILIELALWNTEQKCVLSLTEKIIFIFFVFADDHQCFDCKLQ